MFLKGDNDLDLSRRSFLGGALSLGALAGCRAFRAPAGAFAQDQARLVLGVVSDIHVDAGAGDFRKFGDTVAFEKTLRFFDAQGVDGVVLAGDMADNGMLNQLERVGEAWFRVFPKGRSTRDGRRVEQLFVYGNHDLEGQTYDKFDVRFFHKPSFEAGQIRHDPAGAWRKVFREDYAPIWLKTVKGYQFVGAQWSLGKDPWGGIPEVEEWFKTHAAELDRTKPFFFIQHCHPNDTVYGADAWCPDKGYATRALAAFPNAVAFSGHSHTSLTDERSVWQGAFTSIATSSLRYGGAVDQYAQRQGMVARVYDDRLVLSRYDLMEDADSLGPDWVIPLPAAPRAAFGFETRKAQAVPPEFPAGAAPAIRKEKNGLLLSIPCAAANATRAFRYEIAAGDKIIATVYDVKYNRPRHLAGAPTLYLVKEPVAPESLRVTPLDSFGNRGKTIGVRA